jgi:hypothetical protein
MDEDEDKYAGVGFAALGDRVSGGRIRGYLQRDASGGCIRPMWGR